MKPITFYENKYEDNHLMLCGIYAGKAMKNLCLCVVDMLHFLKRLIKRYPFAVLFVIVFTAVIFSYVEIGNARVSGDVWVFCNAWVSGNAMVSGNAWVLGTAWVRWHAIVREGKVTSGVIDN